MDSAGDLITISCFLPKNIAAIRAVTKRWGPRISPATMNVAPGYFQRKVEEK